MPPQRPWNAAERPALRGALGFTLGGIVALSVSAANMSRHGFLLPAAGFFFSGVIGLVSLFPLLNGRLQAIRAAVGFGLGFLLASGVLLATILPLQEVRENPLAPAAFLIVGCTIAFGVAGLIGGLFLWSGGGMVLPSAASFAAGGGTFSVLLALLFAVVIRVGELGMGWTRAKLTTLPLGIACVLVSYAVGGALFGRALAKRQSGTASTGGVSMRRAEDSSRTR